MINKLRSFLLKLQLDDEAKKEYEILTRGSGKTNTTFIPVHVNIELIKRILKLEGHEVLNIETVDFYGANCFKRIEIRRKNQ